MEGADDGVAEHCCHEFILGLGPPLLLVLSLLALEVRGLEVYSLPWRVGWKMDVWAMSSERQCAEVIYARLLRLASSSAKTLTFISNKTVKGSLITMMSESQN